ncbi:glycerophosphodiester phosphodiesterase [Trichosporon asahii var. asahii CBS 2479]|uniref:Glycerophosphodiester phosphodiesterase n=1 Tax=Trichosporon asahii var. asahii (strain ATCC 90039 / CBS 2479 / JCM 2466 / KCTC 7840 / NBRC 103889/ NCYC 2677 / UAMH 7654) TaxID=1186058 RepID=J4UJZ2_TRIAS|nr:glycerophosphodiester phosphodiesterase [Trichosporon asahii var. asahii CBS 2479]EJT52155.1 glycerophosphodiester phosphodiesterase [Trichosporon asahii var. asahii CBS 2479]
MADSPVRAVKDIQVWGHRGASAFLPENTLASFRAAIKEGADAIESDVHVTSDGVILMFHDPTLDRTTNGSGTIKSQPNVRTTKEPVQPVPRFDQLIDLIMEPENKHVKLNNDPEGLFPEIARILSKYENWEQELAPRIILGLWHPLFIRPAYKYLPSCTRYHIGISPSIARQYFWDACAGFSINFSMLVGSEGQKFIADCRAAGKEVCVWTVNDPNEMRTAMTWGVQAILTDKVGLLTELKKEVVEDPSKVDIPGLAAYWFPWSHWRYYAFTHPWLERTQLDALRTNCYQPGPLHKVDLEDLKPNGANGTPVANGSAENGHAVTAAAEQPAQPAYDGLEKADTFGAHQPVAVAAA